MGLKERLEQKKKKMQDQIKRGRDRTEQQKAERIRKKKQRAKHYEPGTIKYGLHHRQRIGTVMKDALDRRRKRRER